jgi:CRP-like cAMP-binding protein
MESLRNTLLSRLPEHELEQIFPLLDRIWLSADTKLFSVEDRPDYAYFPESSLVGVLTCAEDERLCYVGFYGFEGFGSLATALGVPSTGHTEIVQVAGYAYRIKAADLHAAIVELGQLRRELNCYIHVFMMQIAGTALSNGTRVEQRLARLLLMFQDRMQASTLAITHQRLSDILGVRRSGITEAVHLLESDRLIRAQRGLIDILDRPRLEKLTAGCYGRPEAEYRRLI